MQSPVISFKHAAATTMVNVMFDDYDGLFVPDIDGLPETDYVETVTALLSAGFLVGYSLLKDAIVAGTVISCGFTRLTPIGLALADFHGKRAGVECK